MRKLTEWLIPSFSNTKDEQSTKAVLIHASILTCIALIVFIVIGAQIGGETPVATLAVDGIALFILLMLLFVLHLGKVFLAGLGLVVFGILLVSIGIITLGSIRTPTTSIYLLIILIAGLLFDTKGLFFSVISISLILLGLIFAEMYGFLRDPNHNVTLTQWITFTFIFIMCGSLTKFGTKILRGLLSSLKVEIASRKKLEDNLIGSLREKETLLQEIHHRVKNNMNIISSLLSLHASSTQNKEVQKELVECQSRIYAMSRVHETLYNSSNLAEIDLKTYLEGLTSSLIQTYSLNSDKVRLEIEGEKANVSISKASPLGLSINELITNAMKYAFPGNREGMIKISFHSEGKRLILRVCDNGVGLPVGLNWRKADSMGLKLVKVLIENQLNGSVDADTTNGTAFTITVEME